MFNIFLKDEITLPLFYQLHQGWPCTPLSESEASCWIYVFPHHHLHPLSELMPKPKCARFMSRSASSYLGPESAAWKDSSCFQCSPPSRISWFFCEVSSLPKDSSDNSLFIIIDSFPSSRIYPLFIHFLKARYIWLGFWWA